MDIDFIYFDLLLVTIWIIALLVRKRFKALLFGLFGYAVVFISDDVVWYTIMGTREIDTSGIIGPHLFLAYFSFTYGMIMFSYAPIMFDKKVSKIEKGFWSIGMFGGWLAIALMSQAISWNDTTIDIVRHMDGFRIGQILMVVLGYFALIVMNVLLKYTKWNFIDPQPWWTFIYLFAVGIFIHLSMEATLTIAGIRQPFYWGVFIYNSIMEFNSGIPYLIVMWIIVNRKDYRTLAPAEDLILDIPKSTVSTE
jgi:hypothetical protein